MVIGGSSYAGPGLGLDDVELLSLDPILDPVPDCLTQLRPLPSSIRAAAGALDQSSKYFNNSSGDYIPHKSLSK